MKVKDIMTKDPAVCMPDTSLRDVALMMVDQDCGQIPVIESTLRPRPIGVVTDRDIIVRAVARGMNPIDMTAADVMTSPALTVTPETGVEECAETLADRRVRRMPVIDDDGVCQGIVSQADIAQHAPGKLTAKVVRTVSEPM
jgi:CBS domain-containing protein